MKVRYRETGGFVGIMRGCDLDLDNLSESDRIELSRLIRESRSALLAQRHNPEARDLQNYKIVVEGGDEDDLDAAFDDTNVPKGLTPLLEFLKKHSGPLTLDSLE